MTRSKDAFITPAEAQRAIYIDFEGFADAPPALLGMTVDGRTEQVVLDPQLADAAHTRACRLSSLQDEVAALLARATQEGRAIVAYSQHERNVCLGFAGIDIAPVYRDARKIAKRWANACHGGTPPGGRGLKDFLELIGHARPAHLGERKSTSRLRTVRDMLAQRRHFALLTPVVKAKWTKLLEHNAIDCEGMRALVLRAAAELHRG